MKQRRGGCSAVPGALAWDAAAASRAGNRGGQRARTQCGQPETCASRGARGTRGRTEAAVHLVGEEPRAAAADGVDGGPQVRLRQHRAGRVVREVHGDEGEVGGVVDERAQIGDVEGEAAAIAGVLRRGRVVARLPELDVCAARAGDLVQRLIACRQRLAGTVWRYVLARRLEIVSFGGP